MSEEQLKGFLEKIKGDTSLQEKLKAEGADPVAIAKAAGFTIKQQDLWRPDLSDEELEGVAGGRPTGGDRRCDKSCNTNKVTNCNTICE